jgi:hypothetical protein
VIVTAVLVQHIVPKDDANKHDLKELLLGDVFASVDTSSEGLKPDEQTLLTDDREFLWTTRFEYPVHATPFPTWLLDRVEQVKVQAQAKLSAMATIGSADLYYDATAWHRIFGL